MLGGSVDLRSRLGEGTTVQVSLPLRRPIARSLSSQSSPFSANPQSSTESLASVASKDDSIKLLHATTEGCKVAIHGLSSHIQRDGTHDSVKILAKYITDWYGVELVQLDNTTAPDVVFVKERHAHLVTDRYQQKGTKRRPALIILCSNATRRSEAEGEASKAQTQEIVEFISKPCGPYKLAKVLRDCLIRLRALDVDNVETCQHSPASEGQTSQGQDVSEYLIELDGHTPNKTASAAIAQTNGILAASPLSRNAQSVVDNPSADEALTGKELESYPLANRRSNEHAQSRNDTIASSKSFGTGTGLHELPNFLVPSARTVGVTRASSPRVLLVDDNKINLSLLKAFMKKRMYETVHFAEDGSIAVSKIKAAVEPYDIILMGKRMKHLISLS